MILWHQSESRFENALMIRPFYGKAASVVEPFGQTNAVRITSRHSDTVAMSTPHDERWVFPIDHAGCPTFKQAGMPVLLEIPNSMPQGSPGAGHSRQG
jgi:hypothetical protein